MFVLIRCTAPLLKCVIVEIFFFFLSLRFSGSQHCGHVHCAYQYREHYHCMDPECNYQVSVSTSSTLLSNVFTFMLNFLDSDSQIIKKMGFFLMGPMFLTIFHPGLQ